MLKEIKENMNKLEHLNIYLCTHIYIYIARRKNKDFLKVKYSLSDEVKLYCFRYVQILKI